MRPLGLEGKVGAPAVVRENPLLRRYDEAFVPAWRDGSSIEGLRVVESFLPFSWRDVLGVVSERYAGSADVMLSYFLSLCSRALSDRVLVYDLETPSLDVRLEMDGGRSLLGVLRGSCDWFSSTHALVCGDAGSVIAYDAVVLSPVMHLNLQLGFGLFSPGLAGASFIPVVLNDDVVLCSSVPIEYEKSTAGVVCAPGDLAGLGHPDRSLLGLVDDPLRLRSGLLAVRSSLGAWYSTAEYASLRKRMRSDPKSSNDRFYRRFTPRGASR